LAKIVWCWWSVNELMAWYWQGNTKVLWEKPDLEPLCSWLHNCHSKCVNHSPLPCCQGQWTSVQCTVVCHLLCFFTNILIIQVTIKFGKCTGEHPHMWTGIFMCELKHYEFSFNNCYCACMEGNATWHFSYEQCRTKFHICKVSSCYLCLNIYLCGLQ